MNGCGVRVAILKISSILDAMITNLIKSWPDDSFAFDPFNSTDKAKCKLPDEAHENR